MINLCTLGETTIGYYDRDTHQTPGRVIVYEPQTSDDEQDDQVEYVRINETSPPPKPLESVPSEQVRHRRQGQHGDGDLEDDVDLDPDLVEEVKPIGGKGVPARLVDQPDGTGDQRPTAIDRVPEEVDPACGGEIGLSVSFERDGQLDRGEAGGKVRRVLAVQLHQGPTSGPDLIAFDLVDGRVGREDQSRDGQDRED